MDEVVEALQILHDAGIDPREINVPAIAEAEGRSLVDVARRVVRARRIALDHDVREEGS